MERTISKTKISALYRELVHSGRVDSLAYSVDDLEEWHLENGYEVVE